MIRPQSLVIGVCLTIIFAIVGGGFYVYFFNVQLEQSAIAQALQARQKRGLAGPDISPDGKWELKLDKLGTAASPSFRLYKESTVPAFRIPFFPQQDVQPQTVTLVAKQSLTETEGFQWVPAGWSADGKKVYYAAAKNIPKLNGAGFDMSVYEFNTETSQETLLQHFIGSTLDVQPENDRVLAVEQDIPNARMNIWLSDLHGGNRVNLYSEQATSNIGGLGLQAIQQTFLNPWGALLSPDGKKAIILSGSYKEAVDPKTGLSVQIFPDGWGRVTVMDLVTKKTTSLDDRIANSAKPLYWKDDAHVFFGQYRQDLTRDDPGTEVTIE